MVARPGWAWRGNLWRRGDRAGSIDLTKGKGRFNTLAGLFATALAVGGVAGPLISGFLVQHLGFRMTFYAFAILALVGAMVFSFFVPETEPEPGSVEVDGGETGGLKLRSRIDPQRLLRAQIGIVAEVG